MMVDLKQKVGNFSQNKISNQNQFEKDVSELKDLLGEGMVNKNTIEPLYFLFLNLSSENDSLRFAFIQGGLIQKERGVLADFFIEFINHGFVFPTSAIANKALIKICDKNVAVNLIEKLLESEILSKSSFKQLNQLPKFGIPNLSVFIEIHFKCQSIDLDIDLVFDLIKRLESNQIDEATPDDLVEFINEVLPAFKKKFVDTLSTEGLKIQTKKIVGWYEVWRNHKYQLETNLEADAIYYNTEFAIIIQYVTAYVWWNNGLTYGKGNKVFNFGSPEFYFLATGGSIRKAPHQHSFTRRMARAFVELPFDLDLSEEGDLYIYLYVKSLGGGELLSRLLMEFISHPDHKIHLQKEVDKWNPIIQKLSGEKFEALEEDRAKEFLGYLYHCLRDKPKFTIQRRSIQDLILESDEYYQRIYQRIRVREDRAAERSKEYEKLKKRISWGAHRLIQPRKISITRRTPTEDRYQIIELKNEIELQREGQTLNHCVGTYTSNCKNGYCSIWSLRRLKGDIFHSVVTIEVSRNNRIVQMRGLLNSTPCKEDKQVIQEWAEKEKIVVSVY